MLLLLGAVALPVRAQMLEIRWYTVDGGGGSASTGGDLTLAGTIGQSDAGVAMTGGVFTVTGGYWGPHTTATPADLLIVKTDSADPVLPGSSFSYQLTVSNAGPGTAAALTVTDTLPGGLGFISASGTGWSCDHSGGLITCTRSDLPLGAAPAIIIDVTAPPSAAALLNTAEVAASTADPVGSNNSDTESTTVLASADLSVSKWGDPGPVAPDQPLDYTLEIANAGPDAADAVSVEDTLPTGAVFQSAAGADWTCGEAGGVVTCTLPSIASGSTAAPITVVMTPPNASGTITNWAYVDAASHDPMTGNNSDPAVTEVDATPPMVAGIGSAADTGDGVISDGEAVRAAVTQFIAWFTEEVADPPGDTDPNDVTNPDNFLLVRSGSDGVVSTTSCAAGVDPGDIEVEVATVLYDAPSSTAAVFPSTGDASLSRDRYRLLVCGSTSIVDRVGHRLDGDGNGVGGDDHALDFTVLASNLLLDPNFDVALDPWTATSPTPGEIDHAWHDADGVATSGAAEVVNLTGPGEQFTLRQCVPATADRYYRFGSLARISSSTPGAPSAWGVVDYFSDPGCSGSVTGSLPSAAIVGDSSDLWADDIGSLTRAPLGSESARVWLVVDAGAAADFTVDFDNLIFFDSGFFADDFESGDTGAWSATAGGTP
jgi:uncharacterized repeat protein (TIGR01451 family)